MRALLLLCSLFFLSMQTIDAQLLWKISKKGQPDSYLFGTHHLIPLSILDSKPEVEKAYQKAEVVIGEIDISEMSNPILMSYYQSAMMMPKDSLLNKIVPEAELQVIVEGVKKQGLPIPESSIVGMRPNTISTFLSVTISTKAIQKLFPTNGQQNAIDFLFQQKAQKDGKQIIGLETMKFQTDVLLKSKSFKESLDELLKMFDCMENTDMVKHAIDLTEAYIKEDINKMYAFTYDSSICPSLKPSDKDLDILLYNRNNNWIKLLTNNFLPKQSNFIAVGALHLPGNKGLIKLLEKEGYKLTPIQ